MNILHITPHYHPAMGGAETHMKEISERLALRGHAVTVLTSNSCGASNEGMRNSLKDSEVINQVRVNRFMPADRFQHVLNVFLSLRGGHRLLGLMMGAEKIQMLAAGPWTLRPFQDSLRSKPDVVAVSNWYCSSLPYQMLEARRFRKFALVGIPLFHTEREWSRSPLHARMMHGCDAIVALTEHEKRFIGQRSPRENVHVVGAGVDPSMFVHAAGHKIRARYGIGDRPLVGYVGRMNPSKGVAILIRAMKQIWSTDPDVRLLLAGPGMPTGSGAQDDISLAMAELSDAERARIIIVGRFSEEEKASIFDALDLFAMPSGAESFGIAYLEAWICGKPVIGSRIAATQCVIDDGIDGVLVSPGSSDDLARSIRSLLADRSRREEMGRRGNQKTLTHFTWDKITDQIERVYAQAHAVVVNQPSGASSVRRLRAASHSPER